MGLDVYMYRYESEEEYLEYRKRYYESEYGDVTDPGECVEHDSLIHPKHLFKVGYWRSSYNSGGINNILRETTGKDLYYIANDGDDESTMFAPIWKDWLERAREARHAYEQYLTTDASKYTVMRVGLNAFGNPSPMITDAQAIDMYLNKRDHSFDWFSSGEGSFFVKNPPRVVAAISATNEMFKKPEVILVLEKEDTHTEEHKDDDAEWYLNALDIVIETCEYALDNDGFFTVTWSS